MSRAPWAGIIALAACLPHGDPRWLIDGPRVVAVSMRVREVGPFAPERADVIAEGDVAVAMPGDTIALELLALDEHAVPYDPSDALWISCPLGDCPLGIGPDTLEIACDEDVGEPLSACLLGEAEGLATTMPYPYPLLAGGARETGIMAILPTSPDRTAAECVAGYTTHDDPVWDCRYFAASLPYGPGYALVDAAEALQLSLALEPDDYPAEVRAQPPNRAPILDRLVLAHAGAEIELLADGTATVAVGERVQLRLPDEIVGEDYLAVHRNQGVAEVVEETEALDASWWLSEHVEDFVSHRTPPMASFVIPPSERIEIVMVVHDSRDGRTWLHATLLVSG